MSALLTVREWGELILPPRYDSAGWRERIHRAGETEAGDVFRLQHRKLFARDLVGLLQIGDLQIQIVPKIVDPLPQAFDAAPLLEFLTSCGVSFPAIILSAKTSLGKGPVIEKLLDHIASQMIRDLLEGVPRRYSPIEEHASTIRGRIMISKLARRRPGAEHVVPLRYYPLQIDNPLSQLIKATAIAVRDSSTSVHSRRTLTHVIEELSGVATVRLSPKVVGRVQLGRFEESWRWLVDFAEALARSRTPNLLQSGGRSLFSMLFPLDGLFEALVRRIFKECLSGEGIGMIGKAGREVLLVNERGEPLAHVKPDLLFFDQRNQQLIAIGDAKWKSLEIRSSGPAPAESDVYQLLSYLQRYGLNRGLLVFPASRSLEKVAHVHKVYVLPDQRALFCVELDVLKLLDKATDRAREYREALQRELVPLLREDISHTASATRI